ncbi:hypothetical protein ACSBOB_31190 [Mesorhizobium sp. ASY16-5R]|uniref:hypothetical protein n=1 Tax=Mesorhizobium sp. ASY16-5R TaxID=3445772 RepID=UPI003F9FF686
MERSLLTTTMRSLRNVARMLMNQQSRAERLTNPSLDLRLLSDSMRRDLGLIDGQQVRLERRPYSERQQPEEESTLVRLLLTPHAS